MEAEKCVLVIDPALPQGITANIAAVLGVTLGRLRPGMVGPDVTDGGGAVHPGIITVPIPVLKGDAAFLKDLRRRLCGPEFSALTAADFTDLAQGCRTYEEFQEKMAAAPEESLTYLGLGLCGPRKLVDRLTGSLPLLR